MTTSKALDPSAACDSDCPVQHAARLIEGKWTTLIVRDLLNGSKRFSELQRSLSGISPRLLTARLRLLEVEGVLLRQVYATQPPSTEYSLTVHGRRLQKLIEAMAAFGLASRRRERKLSAPAAATPGVLRHRLR